MMCRDELEVCFRACLATALPALVLGCTAKELPKNAPGGSTPAAVAPLRVSVAKPQRKTIRRVVTQPGQIEAFEEARLYAKLPAYVEKYSVDIGDRVTGPQFDEQGKVIKRGQVLAELSAPELDQEWQQKRAYMTQAGADVEQAQAAVNVAEAESANAQAKVKEMQAAIGRFEAECERWRSEYDRTVQLVAKSVLTQKQADEAKSQLQAAEAGLKEAQAKVESARSALVASRAQIEKSLADEAAVRARREVAEADVARVSALLGYLKIEAPFDGTISKRNAETGYFAQAGGGNQGQPLFTVVRTDQVRVFVDLPEMDAPLADVGDKATVIVQSLSGREFPGQLTRTSWSLDPVSRTLRTEVDVPNPDGLLRPGMYAQVSITLDERTDALAIPVVSVVTQDNSCWCFVAENGKAVRKRVTLGLKAVGEVEVLSGLTGDESVILVKGASMTDGQTVEIQESTPAK